MPHRPQASTAGKVRASIADRLVREPIRLRSARVRPQTSSYRRNRVPSMPSRVAAVRNREGRLRSDGDAPRRPGLPEPSRLPSLPYRQQRPRIRPATATAARDALDEARRTYGAVAREHMSADRYAEGTTPRAAAKPSPLRFRRGLPSPAATEPPLRPDALERLLRPRTLRFDPVALAQLDPMLVLRVERDWRFGDATRMTAAEFFELCAAVTLDSHLRGPATPRDDHGCIPEGKQRPHHDDNVGRVEPACPGASASLTAPHDDNPGGFVSMPESRVLDAPSQGGNDHHGSAARGGPLSPMLTGAREPPSPSLSSDRKLDMSLMQTHPSELMLSSASAAHESRCIAAGDARPPPPPTPVVQLRSPRTPSISLQELVEDASQATPLPGQDSGPASKTPELLWWLWLGGRLRGTAHGSCNDSSSPRVGQLTGRGAC